MLSDKISEGGKFVRIVLYNSSKNPFARWFGKWDSTIYYPSNYTNEQLNKLPPLEQKILLTRDALK